MINFGFINKATKETKYRNETLKEELSNSFRKDAFNAQIDEYGPIRPTIEHRPNERTSRREHYIILW